MSWQRPVLSVSNAGTATKGNRYIVGESPTGEFAGLTTDNIAWYDGTQWQEDVPQAGWVVYDLNQAELLFYENGPSGDYWYYFRDLFGSEGGGGSSQASGITTDTTNFDNNLSSADDTVQKALDTIDDLSIAGLDFVKPDWLPYLRNWLKPELLRRSNVFGTWLSIPNSNDYTIGSSPNSNTYKGYIIPAFAGSHYLRTSNSNEKKIYWGEGSTGNYTWIALLKGDTINLAAGDTLENQYRNTAAANCVIQLSIVDVSGSLYFRIFLRDDSANTLQVDIPIAEISNYTIFVWTYDNSTGVITAYVNGNTYTATNASLDMSLNATLVNNHNSSLGVQLNTSNAAVAGSYWYGEVIERTIFTDVKDSDTLNKLCKDLMNKYDDQTLWTNL